MWDGTNFGNCVLIKPGLETVAVTVLDLGKKLVA
jgi:hypothetical protein